MTIGAGHHLRITAHMKLLGTIDIENVYDVRSNSTGVDTDLHAMEDMAVWLDGAYNEINTLLHTSLLFVDVRGFNVSADEPLPTVPWPSQTAGLDSSDLLATGVSLVTLFHTVKSRVIGRKFIGGFTEQAVTLGLAAASAIANLTNFTLDIIAGPTGTLSGGDFDYVIVDKVGIMRTPVRAVVSAIPGYQRRRRSGVGS